MYSESMSSQNIHTLPKDNGVEMVTDLSLSGNGSAAADSIGLEEYDGGHNATKSSSTDAENMRRMGRDQELVRNFRMFSMASFAAMATAIWEFSLFQISPALINGGRPVLIYATIWSFIGFAPIYLSMAEMSSMAPIAGAQYHWVSEFAPERMQKVLSYVSGYVLVIPFHLDMIISTNTSVQIGGLPLSHGKQATHWVSSSLGP